MVGEWKDEITEINRGLGENQQLSIAKAIPWTDELLTCVTSFHKAIARLIQALIHPGYIPDPIESNTSFDKQALHIHEQYKYAAETYLQLILHILDVSRKEPNDTENREHILDFYPQEKKLYHLPVYTDPDNRLLSYQKNEDIMKLLGDCAVMLLQLDHTRNLPKYTVNVDQMSVKLTSDLKALRKRRLEGWVQQDYINLAQWALDHRILPHSTPTPTPTHTSRTIMTHLLSKLASSLLNKQHFSCREVVGLVIRFITNTDTTNVLPCTSV